MALIDCTKETYSYYKSECVLGSLWNSRTYELNAIKTSKCGVARKAKDKDILFCLDTWRSTTPTIQDNTLESGDLHCMATPLYFVVKDSGKVRFLDFSSNVYFGVEHLLYMFEYMNEYFTDDIICAIHIAKFMAISDSCKIEWPKPFDDVVHKRYIYPDDYDDYCQ